MGSEAHGGDKFSGARGARQPLRAGLGRRHGVSAVRQVAQIQRTRLCPAARLKTRARVLAARSINRGKQWYGEYQDAESVGHAGISGGFAPYSQWQGYDAQV